MQSKNNKNQSLSNLDITIWVFIFPMKKVFKLQILPIFAPNALIKNYIKAIKLSNQILSP